MKVFRVWCEVSSAYDNERGFKRYISHTYHALDLLTLLRLRTRQRYVQLAEGKLEEKKAHCQLHAFTVFVKLM
jgi:hypothetical protein